MPNQLKAYGEVRRGRLGVAVQDLTPEVATALGIRETRGAVITRVDAGSPGDTAGLKAGDLVTKINGAPIRHARDLRNAVGLSAADAELTIVVLRNGGDRDKRADVSSWHIATKSGTHDLAEFASAFGIMRKQNFCSLQVLLAAPRFLPVVSSRSSNEKPVADGAPACVERRRRRCRDLLPDFPDFPWRRLRYRTILPRSAPEAGVFSK